MSASLMVDTRTELCTRVIRTDAELQHLGPSWKHLFQRVGCENVFQSFEWMSAWWKHFGKSGCLFVVTVHDSEGLLVGLAPLYISRRRGPLQIHRLGFLGDRLVGSDYLDFLVDKTYLPSVLDCIYDLVIGNRCEWDYIDLADMPADSLACAAFQNKGASDGMRINLTPSTLCPCTPLPQTPEEYVANLRPKLRQNLRYNLRALQRKGSVEFVLFDHSSEAESALDDLNRLHETRFEQLGLQSAFLNPYVRDFHREVILSASKAGWAQVYELRVDGKPVAALYGFSIGAKFSMYQNGFDPAYSRFSVGSLLISHAINNSIRSGHTEFDLLRGDEPYKRFWSTTARSLYSATLFDRRAKSRLAGSERAVRDSLRRGKATLNRIGSCFAGLSTRSS